MNIFKWFKSFPKRQRIIIIIVVVISALALGLSLFDFFIHDLLWLN